MDYCAPVDEMLLQLEYLCNVKQLQKFNKYENLDLCTIKTILDEAAKLSSKTIAPLNRVGDKIHPRKETDQVLCPPGFIEAYEQISLGGWVGMSASQDYGGMDLPLVIGSCVNEMLGSACLSLALNPLMTQGQIEALQSHASEELKNCYLPNLISGRWSGTMNLTEENAGSDVGALTTSAVLKDDGTYEISGQKIYISWGEHNLTENICHLVLARLPGSQKGTRGISLFLVPKYLPSLNDKIGKRNSLIVTAIEEKMGLHGSPTAVMEYNKAKGWLVGKPNDGMSAMFTMMNNARLGVAVQGLSQAERALQKAVVHSKDRKQGRSQIENGTGAIIDHADVRKNLLSMKALTSVSRSLCLDTAMSIDLAKISGCPIQMNRAAFLIPIAKAFSTENGCRVADIGIQVHGGLGFIESSGVPQLYRDVRITAIYEGTNGIQAMDLVNRKLSDGGAAGFALVQELIDTEQICRHAGTMKEGSIEEFHNARLHLLNGLNWMLNTQNINERYAGATQFLKAFGLILGAHYLLKVAAKSQNLEKLELAQFYIDHILPESFAALKSACRGTKSIYRTKV
ncbi:MAG: acyl-CoA dehydrogenase [Paracoccaceae bacterium]|nr:acyl-CoA dehydrogenase [Paracoccaceae bacterium]